MKVLRYPPVSIPALFFGMFSVLNIWLLAKIALALGASENQALFSAFLLATASTFFYYSRHILPYDLSLACGMSMILIASIRNPTLKWLWVCGFLGAAAFITYNGYWFFTAFALLICAVTGRPHLTEVFRRAFWLGISFALPLLILIALSRGDLLTSFLKRASIINQGSFEEGGTFPFEFLWHAEHLLLILWLGALALSVWAIVRRQATGVMLFGVSGVLWIYTAMVLLSVVLHKFVIYGRSVRPLVPLLCLLTACHLERLRLRGDFGKRVCQVFCILIVIQASFNFYSPLVQSFPADFRPKAERMIGDDDKQQYSLLYAALIYPEQTDFDALPPLPPHEVVMRASHPLQFLPYQYEGYKPEERMRLRSHDISMRLIRLLDTPQ